MEQKSILTAKIRFRNCTRRFRTTLLAQNCTIKGQMVALLEFFKAAGINFISSDKQQRFLVSIFRFFSKQIGIHLINSIFRNDRYEDVGTYNKKIPDGSSAHRPSRHCCRPACCSDPHHRLVYKSYSQFLLWTFIEGLIAVTARCEISISSDKGSCSHSCYAP